LEKNNMQFHVVDTLQPNSSTSVSGGIINPITGRKYALQWNIENLLTAAHHTYSAFESILQQKIFRPAEIMRLHKSADALAVWNERKHLLENTNWVSEIPTLPENTEIFHNNFGGILIHNAIQVFPEILINSYAAHLKNIKCLVHLPFDYAALTIHPDYFLWNNAKYRHIIFCEGYHAMHNPYWEFLKFKPVKGECLTIHIPKLSTEIIFQKEISIVPLGNETFWVGGTNTWDDYINTPTPDGLAILKQKLAQLLQTPYTLLKHRAAVRPTMKDRTPVAGPHPEIKNMFILNGMGTKGFSLAPYYATELVTHILQNIPLTKNVSPARFIKSN
ncbi:MAG: NAD(P)/FAD-dependent oxidoreductase, partial [Chitinophagales bacterium]